MDNHHVEAHRLWSTPNRLPLKDLLKGSALNTYLVNLVSGSRALVLVTTHFYEMTALILIVCFDLFGLKHRLNY